MSAQDVQFLGGTAFGGESGGGNLDVRAGLGEVAGGVLAQDEVLGHVVGDDERAPAGLGDGQAECGAGAQGLADHRAAHAVLLGQGGFGAEFGADRQRAGFDVPAEGIEDSFGCTEARERRWPRLRTDRLSCCPAV